jgi:hypothetical protein
MFRFTVRDKKRAWQVAYAPPFPVNVISKEFVAFSKSHFPLHGQQTPYLFHRSTAVVSLRLLIVEVSRSHSHTTLGRTPLDEGSTDRRDLYLTNTQHSQDTDIHAHSGIRTRNHIKPSATPVIPCSYSFLFCVVSWCVISFMFPSTRSSRRVRETW